MVIVHVQTWSEETNLAKLKARMEQAMQALLAEVCQDSERGSQEQCRARGGAHEGNGVSAGVVVYAEACNNVHAQNNETSKRELSFRIEINKISKS